MIIRGIIETGAGKGAFFVGLDWVVRQFREHMGFAPYPGTLNVRVLGEDLSAAEDFFSQKDFDLVPEDPSFCKAGVKRLTINGLPAAAVFPSDDVRIHDNHVIEIIAGCHVKERLKLKDGDSVILTDYQGDAEHSAR
jgi:CTP-dependent riboflavin kinase